MPSGRSPSTGPTRSLAIGIAVLLGLALSYALRFTAWPEIPAYAYLVTRGLRLYDDIFYPHTPALILVAAAAGKLFGFTPLVLRTLGGLPLALTAALLVAGARPGRGGASIALPLLLGVPVLLLFNVWAGGPTLWPDPFLAPVVLLACLLLERYDHRRRSRDAILGCLLLGAAILVKQTSAWVAFAALAWLVSRSASRRALGGAAVGIVLPYATFCVLWATLFGTLQHIRWTLLVPFRLSHAVRTPHDLSVVHEAIPPFLGLLAAGLAFAALPFARVRRSPAGWLAIGTVGMAFPRTDLLHLTAAHGVLVLLLVRSVLALVVFARRGRRASPPFGRTLLASLGAACAAVMTGVAVLAGGEFARDDFRGPTYYWTDPASRRWEQIVRKRVHPGDEVYLFNIPWDTLYPRLELLPPGRVFANSTFFYCLSEEGAGERIVEGMARRPGTLVLFREADDPDVRRTAVHRYLTTRTSLVERIDETTCWRRVDGP